MMQIRNPLLDAGGARVDLLASLAPPPLQSMQAKQKPVFGLHYVLFGLVPPELAEFDKIGGISHGIRYCYNRSEQVSHLCVFHTISYDLNLTLTLLLALDLALCWSCVLVK